MELSASLETTVFDKNRVRVGSVSNPVDVVAYERWLAQGTAEIKVAATDPINEHLIAEGSRVLIKYFPLGGTSEDVLVGSESLGYAEPAGYAEPNGYVGLDDLDPVSAASLGGFQVCSGLVRNPVGSFLPSGTVTYQVQDDWVYTQTPMLVNPEGNIEATSLADTAQTWATGVTLPGTVQGLSGRYVWPDAPVVWPAESAVNHVLTVFLQQVFARLGIDGRFTPPADSRRGIDVRPLLPQVRFDTIESVIVPWLEASNLGLRFEMLDDGSTTWRMWEAQEWEKPFTPESGVLLDGTWSLADPEATHVIVGGPGEEAARAFRLVSDATGLMELYNDLRLVFRDATGAPTPWDGVDTDYQVPAYYSLLAAVSDAAKAEFEKFLATAGADALSDGAPTAGVSLTMSESKGFRFVGAAAIGRPFLGFMTGDHITVSPSSETALSGLTFTQRITQTTISLTRDNGLTVTGTLGEVKDDPNVTLVKLIRSVANAIRRKNTNL